MAVSASVTPTSPVVRFGDLGPLRIERLDGEVELLRGRRITAALALLLVRANQNVSTDALVDAVWGERPTEGAASTLDSHVWRLRRLLEPDRRRGAPFTTILHDGTGFRLAANEEQVDSLQFEKLAGDARDLLLTEQPDRALARCQEALALWRGQPWSPHSDEAWALAPVSRLHEIRDQVCEHRLQALLHLGDPETVLADAEPLLAAAPLREKLWAMAVLAAYRTGRIDQALDTYQRARHTLIEETGLEPGAELRDLHAKILARDPALVGPATARPAISEPPPVEVHLPHRRTPLLGRDQEAQQLVQLVATRSLVTLVGSAGCGKTRLAIEVARQAADRFPDGVWFFDLTYAADTGQLLDVVTSELAMSVPQVGTVAEALRSFTKHRRMLMVFDNCEHLLVDVAGLTDTLLGQHSEVTVLATSREPLDLDDEYVWHLPPLSTTSSSEVEPPAVQLFLQRLTAAAPSLDPGPRELELVREICHRVDGLPLAIELAAGQARSFTLDEIAVRVRTDLANLSRTGRGGNRHHATLRGAIDVSTTTLDPVELAVHHCVAVVSGPFTAELAAHLTDLSPGRVSTALAGLVHRSLLTPLGAAHPDGPSRFAQLATVRAHGLTAAPELSSRAVARRDGWVDTLIKQMPTVGDIAELTWHARVHADYAAVRATLQHCLVDHPDPIGAAVAGRLGLYWGYHGMAAEWRRWTDLARRSSAALSYDRLLTQVSHATVTGLLDGSDLYSAWLDDLDDALATMTLEQTVWVAQYLPAVCVTAWTTRTWEVCNRAAATLRSIANQTGHALLDLFAEVSEVIARSETGEPSLLPEIEHCYQRAVVAENFYVRWLACIAGAVAGLTTGSPGAGLRWSDRQVEEFGQLGIELTVPALELRGSLLAMTGQPYQAVKVLAHARALARRVGSRWPTMPSTADTLTAATEQLPDIDSERAYREGTLELRSRLIQPAQQRPLERPEE